MPAGSKKGEWRGGSRKGIRNQRTRAIAEKATAGGITPLEYMIGVLRDNNASPERRADMAKAAAPYMHPRLTVTEVKGTIEHAHYVIRAPQVVTEPVEWQKQHAPKAKAIQ